MWVQKRRPGNDSSVTLEWRGNTLWIVTLPVDAMGRLVNCNPGDQTETEVLAALLAGVRVCVPREALEYRNYRKSAPLGIYRRLMTLERQLREMGVIVVRNCGGKPLGDQKILCAGGDNLFDGAVDRM